MTYCIVSPFCGGPGFTAPGEDLVYLQIDNRCNHYSPCQIYQREYERAYEDVIIYAHDDVKIHDLGWLYGVLAIHELKENVAAVGLGGATGLGNKDLYRKPYRIDNMARSGYASNQDDAEVHGERFGGIRRVAVLDAFFMAVSRRFLDLTGGWPVDHITHHCIDLWLACEAARRGWNIWTLGAACLHHGGGTSIKQEYADAKWLQGGTRDSDHAIPHRWLFEEYRDVLPIEVNNNDGVGRISDKHSPSLL